ncbi:N-acetylmuramoyl-L-alanine amidase [Robertmurraya korlensis]|uniref:N-acetylmuramoyl-L-alanine amidase n=1 Tax=Robertmurraya korlensis TaxID=519977 RepID=UPI0008264D62|nr:N-acetylmuramoyl-L-alanine amidase [Robertmurraya korlensis]
MRSKALFLIGLLLFSLLFPLKVDIAYAQESIIKGNFEEDSSYYLIHYNGEEQSIEVAEGVNVTLKNWGDESKASVDGTVLTQVDSATKDITMEVSDSLNELVLTENNRIHYRIVPSDTSRVEIVKPLNYEQDVTLVSSNENQTSVEEVTTIDEYKTVIEKTTVYYFKDANDQKVEISKEEYDELSQVTVDLTDTNDMQLIQDGPTNEEILFSTSSATSVSYSTHVQDIGWQAPVANGGLSGTMGQSKRLEAIKISLSNTPYSGGISYKTHVESNGWLGNVSNGGVSGTTGQGKRIEAIQVSLTGDMANYYDVYYRVHAQDYGWLGWAKNGMSAGTEGLSKRLEAIQIVLVVKGGAAPGSTENTFKTNTTVAYSTHVQDYGWMSTVKNGELSGTEGQSKRLEAIKIQLQNAPFSGGVTYTTHVQDFGWLSNVSNNSISGTSGQGKRMEAIKISLTGDIANHYDIYYRVHIESYGWLGWAKNGMKAGSEGLSKRLEGIEIKLLPKGQGQYVTQSGAFKQLKQTVFLDPGHGGSDPGAVAGGYTEANLNLAVAKKVESLLVSRGYVVYMSRTGNTALSLLERSQMANNLNTDIFISIHHNSSVDKSANGIESYYYEYNPNNPSKINGDMHNNPDRVNKSITLADLIQENMVDYTGAYDRGTDGSSFSVVRESSMPATLLELGFISNDGERQKLVTDSYQSILARAIADGIDEYFRIY